MANLGKIRALALGLAAAVAMTGSAGAQRSSDGDYLYEYRYFSDATHAEQVGYSVDPCSGSEYLDGQRTEFFTQNIIGYREGNQCIYL